MTKKPLISRKQLTALLNRIDELQECGEDKEGYTLIRYAEVTLEVVKWAERR